MSVCKTLNAIFLNRQIDVKLKNIRTLLAKLMWIKIPVFFCFKYHEFLNSPSPVEALLTQAIGKISRITGILYQNVELQTFYALKYVLTKASYQSRAFIYLKWQNLNFFLQIIWKCFSSPIWLQFLWDLKDKNLGFRISF